ncbi:MAG: hypothetical protein CSA58_01840 [Micrococcales bacterium]|nr:MAG: hypothetical protein CSA58_01840 [Micrococcales bacterium]
MLYEERLWPTPGIWVIAAVMAAGAGIALNPLGKPLVAVVAVAVFIPVAAALTHFAITIRVDADELRVGKAHIDTSLLSGAESFDEEQARYAKGPGLDARAYLAMRGWLSGVVRIGLDDPSDPTPYWLVSSRNPQALAAAVNEAVAARR